MANFQIDLKELKDTIVPDNSKVPLKGNENKIIRVAFDLFRFKDGDPEELWQVQSSDDGEFLVRTYALPGDEGNIEPSKWSVQADKKEENITVSYLNTPILKIAAKKYGITDPNDVRLLERVIYNKLATDNNFVNKVVRSLSIEKQTLLKNAGLSIEINPRLIMLEKYLKSKKVG